MKKPCRQAGISLAAINTTKNEIATPFDKLPPLKLGGQAGLAMTGL